MTLHHTFFSKKINSLGTTRAKSGKAGFIKVDKDYVLSFAEKSKTAGVKQFHLMSSHGANANSYFLMTQVHSAIADFNNRFFIAFFVSSFLHSF